MKNNYPKTNAKKLSDETLLEERQTKLEGKIKQKNLIANLQTVHRSA